MDPEVLLRGVPAQVKRKVRSVVNFSKSEFVVELDFQSVDKMHIVGCFKQIRILGNVRNGLGREISLKI